MAQRIDILIIIGCGNKTRTQKEVCEIFNNKYSGKHFSQSTVSKIEKKFLIERLGRNVQFTDEKKLDLLLEIEENPHNTTRELAAKNDVSKSTILWVLHKEKYHPYKVQLVKELNEDDPDRRQKFCELMMNIMNADLQFINKIVFSGEATFDLNGKVNRQICRYWSRANRHWMCEIHIQYPKKLTFGLVLY